MTLPRRLSKTHPKIGRGPAKLFGPIRLLGEIGATITRLFPNGQDPAARHDGKTFQVHFLGQGKVAWRASNIPAAATWRDLSGWVLDQFKKLFITIPRES
jgi:hypothetical protein